MNWQNVIMHARHIILLIVCLLTGWLRAQVHIPDVYLGKFPYYIGNTHYEIEDHVYKNYKINPELLDTNGLVDNSKIIQLYLDSAALHTKGDSCIMVELPPGRLLINNELRLFSNTALKGQGKRTTLLLQTGEGKHGILISPAQFNTSFSLVLARPVYRGDREIWVRAAEYNAYLQLKGKPEYVTVEKLDDSGLVFSDWAKGCIREHFFIDSAIDMGAFILLRTAHPLAGLKQENIQQDLSIDSKYSYAMDSARTRIFIPESIKNAGLMCMSMQRIDSTTTQTSNIYLDQAYNCLIRDVTSLETNFAHICVHNSAFNLIKRCDLRKSHGYGGNGRAYGVSLEMGSSSNVVIDNYFNMLRHSVLLQSGASGNVIYANVSQNTYWDEGVYPKDASGDIVLHGNYPHDNLIEMNSVQQIVIDDSHGRNGPYNLFYRNKINNYGILMSAANGSDSQGFVGNEVVNTGFVKGLYALKDKGHFEYGNRVKGNIIPSGSTGIYPSFLWRPDCANPGSFKFLPLCFPAVQNAPFGYPFDVSSDDSLPALKRTLYPGIPSCGAYYDKQFNMPNTSIEKPASQLFSVYPNPASVKVFITSAGEGTLSVYNLNGYLVKTLSVEKGITTLLLEDFPSGIYILHFNDGKQSVIQKLLIYDMK